MKEMIAIQRAQQRLKNEMFRTMSALKKRREEMVDRANFFQNAADACGQQIKEVEAMHKAMFGQDMAAVDGWQEPINADDYVAVDANGETTAWPPAQRKKNYKGNY